MTLRPTFPLREHLLGAHLCGAFIDDSGTPGQQSPSDHLHPQRKTWIALVLEATHVATTYRELPGALMELNKHVSATEFHAADIYSGRGPYASVPLSKRVAFLGFLAELFATYQFPVLVQTFSPANVAEHEAALAAAGTIGPFDFTQPADAGLLLLVRKIREHLAQRAETFPEPCLLVADEGGCKAGVFTPIPPFSSFALYGGLFFEKSHSVPPLQLADFAAFALSRGEWLLAKQQRTELDDWILRLFSWLTPCYVGLPTVEVDPATWTSEDYDKFHERDRASKRLPPKPPLT